MLRFSLFALLGQALAEDINVDLRLLGANGTAGNATGAGGAKKPTGNGTTPKGNGTDDAVASAIGPNATDVSADFAVPQTFDLGLGANATDATKAAAVKILCENAKFAASAKTSMHTLLKSTLPGLLATHLSNPRCKLTGSKLRQLGAAAAGGVAVDMQMRITAPKTSDFAKTLDAKKGTDSLNDVLAKEIVTKLKASGADLAKGMASAMNAAAADPAFKTALEANPATAAVAANVVKASKDITAAGITVKTADIKAQGAGSTKPVDATGYTSKTAPAAKSTSGAATTAVAALAAVFASALLF